MVFIANAPINLKPAGGEAGHGVGIWLLLLALGWVFWLILPSKGRGYLNLSSPNVGVLNIDLNEETETEITFPASRMRYMSLKS